MHMSSMFLYINKSTGIYTRIYTSFSIHMYLQTTPYLSNIHLHPCDQWYNCRFGSHTSSI